MDDKNDVIALIAQAEEVRDDRLQLLSESLALPTAPLSTSSRFPSHNALSKQE